MQVVVGKLRVALTPRLLISNENMETHYCLLESYCKAKLPADAITTISWLHTKSGGICLEDMGVDPYTKSNHSSKVLDAALTSEFSMMEPYYAELPMHDKLGCHRVLLEKPIQLPSTMVSSILPLETSRMTAAEADAQFGDNYKSHEVVLQARQSGLAEHLIRPIAIYSDGVVYTKKDSFLVITVHDLKSDTKHVISLFRAGLRVCIFCGCFRFSWPELVLLLLL